MATRCHLLSGCLLALCQVLVTQPAICAETRILIAVGIGGDARYQQEFEQQGNALSRHFRTVANDVTLLQAEHANRDAIYQALTEINKRTEADDALVLMFVGHGTYDGEHFRFNVKGPDFTALELADWLEPVRAGQQLVVFTGSSSGAVLEPLELDTRTVFAATRSGEERNATVFGQFFVTAFEDNSADTNKDFRVTAFEAFQYASTRVEEYYDSQNTMMTEHPTSNGSESAIILAHLGTGSFEQFVSSPLQTRVDELEREINALKVNKAQYSQDEYFDQLQRLLLELAYIAMELKSSTEGDMP